MFFSVRKIDDPIGLLPGRIILGINKRGVRFKTSTFYFHEPMLSLRMFYVRFFHIMDQFVYSFSYRCIFSAQFQKNICIQQS